MIKVLHVLAYLNRDGVGVWLLNLLRGLDRAKFTCDVVGHVIDGGRYEAELRELGVRTWRTPHPYLLWTWKKEFRALLRERGPYDVMHSHFVPVGAPLAWAKAAGIPVRIAQSHTSLVELGTKPWPINAVAAKVSRRLVDVNATAGIAVSGAAAVAKFGPAWRADPRWRVLQGGVDLTPFQAALDRTALRAAIGIPADAWVVGTLGRLADEKNPQFLLEVAGAIARDIPAAHFVFAGDGPLRDALEARAAELGIKDRVHLTGYTVKAAEVLRLFDVFAFPSKFEGLGLALVEAQAAGLPCVVSERVPEEATAVPRLVRRLPLEAGVTAWKDALVSTRAAPAMDRAEALETVAAGPFAAEHAVAAMAEEYETLVARAHAGGISG